MPKNLSNELKELRRKPRMTQAEIAERVGANRTQYANWEYGVTSIPAEFAAKLHQLGLNAPTEDQPENVVRATKTHLRLLINILADATIADGLRQDAREELERVLNLS